MHFYLLALLFIFSAQSVFAELIIRKNSIADSIITLERTEDENITFESKIILKKGKKKCVANVMEFEGYMVKVDAHKCAFKDKINVGDIAHSPSERRVVATAQQDLAMATVKDRKWAEQFWYLGFPAMSKTYAAIDIVSDPLKVEAKSRDAGTTTKTEVETQRQSLRVGGRLGSNLHLILDAAQGQKGISSQQWEGTEYFGLGVVFGVSPKEDNVSNLGIIYYPELGKSKSPIGDVKGNMYGPGKTSLCARTIYENDGSAYVFNANLLFSSPYSFDETNLETTLGGYGKLQLTIGTIFGTPDFHVSPFVGISYKSTTADEYYNSGSDINIKDLATAAVGTTAGINFQYNPAPYASLGLAIQYSSSTYEVESTTTDSTPTTTSEQFEYSQSDVKTVFSIIFRGI